MSDTITVFIHTIASTPTFQFLLFFVVIVVIMAVVMSEEK